MDNTNNTDNYNAEYISEGDLVNRWRCHLATVRRRANEASMAVILKSNQRVYKMDDVLLVEAVKPVRQYTKGGKNGSGRLARNHNKKSGIVVSVPVKPQAQAITPRSILNIFVDKLKHLFCK